MHTLPDLREALRPTNLSHTEIPAADLLARDADGEFTEVNKALRIADAVMCKSLEEQTTQARSETLLPAAAITSLVQLIHAQATRHDQINAALEKNHDKLTASNQSLVAAARRALNVLKAQGHTIQPGNALHALDTAITAHTASPPSICVHGPRGCGKTYNAQQIARALQLSQVIDDLPLRTARIPSHGALVLSLLPEPGMQCMTFADAMKRVRGAA